MRGWIAAAAACALAGCQTSAEAPPSPAPMYRLIDLTDDYAAFYDRTQGMETAARVAAFKADMTLVFPGFYDVARLGPGASAARYDARIARSFEDFPAARAGIADTARRFTTMLDPALASFLRAYPDMGAIGDIYLVNSLGEMDGGTRDIHGRSVLVFGADVMSGLHPFEDEEPFFHHELFHVYHQQWFAGCDQVWCSLWSEGLAVLAARDLNPDATDAQLLLTLPEPIPAAVEANRAEAVCTVGEKLQSEASEDFNALFSFDRLNERLPPRFGYYVGYLVAREAARTRTTAELAHLSVEQAQAVVNAAIDTVAVCPL